MENQSKILQILRSAKGMKQVKMGEKLNITQCQLQRIESGDKPFSIETFIKYAAIIGIAPTILLECLIIGIADPDEAIRRSINALNNPQLLDFSKQNDFVKIVRKFVNDNPNELTMELKKILAFHGITLKG